MEQGYLAITDDEVQVRVRRKDDSHVLTVKQGAGEVRLEEEIEIDPEVFESLWSLTEDRRLRKRRHYVGERPLIEVDVYEGALEGLAIAEVEFGSAEEADRFEPPEWFGRELTGDARYANVSLAVNGRPEAGA